MEIERRYVKVADLELRRGKDQSATKLEGYAVRYGSMSEDLGFKEIIAPGAFSKHLRGDPDVRALVEHKSEKIIGRTAAKTLQLIDDDAGVRVSIDPPDTQVGRDVVESVRRGDLTAMSFGFRAITDSWATRNGEPVRTIHEAELFDVSVTAFPSYPDTTIAVRSLDRWRKENKTMTTKTKDGTAPPKATVTNPEPKPTDSEPKPERRSAPSQPAQTSSARPSDAREWRDCRTGQEVRVFRPDQNFRDAYHSEEPLSLGRAIRALIIGDWSHAPAEHRALSTTANPTAGILVPNPLAASVIDKARALSVLLGKSKARTVVMESGTLTIARQVTDPTVENKAENVSFTGSDATFDAVTLTAYTLGCLVKMSRELASDAPNAVALIEDVIAKALAEKIDYYGLQGTGSNQPLGLINFPNLNTTAVGGSIDYDDLLDATSLIEVDNYQPNAYVLSPANVNTLRQLKVNSEANHYATAPAAVQALTGLVTNNMPDATGVVGDFSKFLFGLRQGVTIEVSTEADTAFAAHQVWIKATWRGDFAAEHPNAFATMTGIS